MASRRLTFGTLPERPLGSVCLCCRKCGHTFSCHRSDYFTVPQQLSPRCEDCGILLKLVRKVVRYVTISIEEAEAPRG